MTAVLSALAVIAVLGYRHVESSGTPSATSIALNRLDAPGSNRLSDWHGRPLVVNLFASWCPACLTELPAFEKVSHDYAGRVVIVGVVSRDSPSSGLALARQLGVTYPLLSDTDRAELYGALGGQGMPVTAFIDRGGEVTQVYSGALDEALLRQLIDKLLRS